MKPGIYRDLPMADYLAIDALSTTPVRALIEECPRAGWWRSRLNPARPREVSNEMDLGTIAHGILLEGSTDGVVVIDALDEDELAEDADDSVDRGEHEAGQATGMADPEGDQA